MLEGMRGTALRMGVTLVVALVAACGESSSEPPDATSTAGAGGTAGDGLTIATGGAYVGGAGGTVDEGTGGAGGEVAAPPSVLLFTKTAGYHHASIADAVPALQTRCGELGWPVQHSNDATIFSESGLAEFDVVVFLLTSGDVLDTGQQAALRTFVQSGGGWVGVHSASDTEYDWAWFGVLVAAHFAGHTGNQNADLIVELPDHPAAAHLPPVWVRYDEWYSFDKNPRDDVDVILSLDESSYNPSGLAMGDHPIAWSHEYDGGRAFYTAGGHTSESYADPAFLQHITGGIEWVAAAR